MNFHPGVEASVVTSSTSSTTSSAHIANPNLTINTSASGDTFSNSSVTFTVSGAQTGFTVTVSGGSLSSTTASTGTWTLPDGYGTATIRVTESTGAADSDTVSLLHVKAATTSDNGTFANAAVASRTHAISAAGRYVAFSTTATNLHASDSDATEDVYVKDMQTGSVTLISKSSSGTKGNGTSYIGDISGDGNVVCFISSATNLVAGDTNGMSDIFIHNLTSGVTERVSLTNAGAQVGMLSSSACALNSTGSKVAMTITSAAQMPGCNGSAFIYVRDTGAATTEIASVSSAGVCPNGSNELGDISADGTTVVFTSFGSNLVVGDTNGSSDVFSRTLATSTTTLVSASSAGTIGGSVSSGGYVSSDGSLVGFTSTANNLVAGDTNNAQDIFLKNVVSGAIERVSLSSSGAQTSDHVSLRGMSSDGNWFIVMAATPSDIVTGMPSGATFFLRSRSAAKNYPASISYRGGGWPQIEARVRLRSRLTAGIIYSRIARTSLRQTLLTLTSLLALHPLTDSSPWQVRQRSIRMRPRAILSRERSIARTVFPLPQVRSRAQQEAAPTRHRGPLGPQRSP